MPKTNALPSNGGGREIAADGHKLRFSTRDAAFYLTETHALRCAASTLEKLRSTGGGPRFVRFGRTVAYERAALDAWVAEKISPPQRTTSDAE
jgi:hypothetical protein